MFQSYALFPHLDVFENVAFGLRRRGIKDVSAAVTAMLELVELGNLARRKPGQLSGGQQQRVAVARALINQPGVLLLDEPLGALDLKLRRQMQIELKRIQTEVGTSFVHVTHDQEEAMTMADTVAVMNQGRIEQMGAPVDIYDLPRTRFVATFLGQSNEVSGRVVGNSRAVTCMVEASGLTIRSARRPFGRGFRPRSSSAFGRRNCRSRRQRQRRSVTVSDFGARQCHRRSFTGVSTQYLVMTPGVGEWMVFEQNRMRSVGRCDPVTKSSCTGDPNTPSVSQPGGSAAESGLSHAGHRSHNRGESRSPSCLIGLVAAAVSHGVSAASARPGLARCLLRHPDRDAVLHQPAGTGGRPSGVYQAAFQISNYAQALGDYWPQFVRSFVYAGIATILALIIAYPLAYFIAFKAGRWRAIMLVLVVAPFFASFLLRTYAWRTILSDEGAITTALNALHLLPEDRILNTPIAVVFGLTYNFLPFMILPLYALAGEDRSPIDRGSGRPVRPAVHRVPQGRVPPESPGSRRRHPADLHPGRR